MTAFASALLLVTTFQNCGGALSNQDGVLIAGVPLKADNPSQVSIYLSVGDGEELDPAQIESITLSVEAEGKAVRNYFWKKDSAMGEPSALVEMLIEKGTARVLKGVLVAKGTRGKEFVEYQGEIQFDLDVNKYNVLLNLQPIY